MREFLRRGFLMNRVGTEASINPYHFRNCNLGFVEYKF